MLHLTESQGHVSPVLEDVLQLPIATSVIVRYHWQVNSCFAISVQVFPTIYFHRTSCERCPLYSLNSSARTVRDKCGDVASVQALRHPSAIPLKLSEDYLSKLRSMLTTFLWEEPCSSGVLIKKKSISWTSEWLTSFASVSEQRRPCCCSEHSPSIFPNWISFSWPSLAQKR